MSIYLYLTKIGRLYLPDQPWDLLWLGWSMSLLHGNRLELLPLSIYLFLPLYLSISFSLFICLTFSLSVCFLFTNIQTTTYHCSLCGPLCSSSQPLFNCQTISIVYVKAWLVFTVCYALSSSHIPLSLSPTFSLSLSLSFFILSLSLSPIQSFSHTLPQSVYLSFSLPHYLSIFLSPHSFH